MDDDSFMSRYKEGLAAFHSAKQQAFLQDIINLIRGKPVRLLSFDDIRARLRLRAENYVGIQDIPLEKIVGSVGRYHEFTAAFLPRQDRSQTRWSRVYAQAVGLQGLPPIEVYKVGDVYFVRDGNHRVSVARKLKAKTIQAEVIELPTPIGLKPGMSSKALDAATCYAAFLDEAGFLFGRFAFAPLELSEPTRYNDLLGHINLQRCVQECQDACMLSLQEAAAVWYDTVYCPFVCMLRKYGVMDHFPGRTEADFYLWAVDHLCECEESCGTSIQAEPLQQIMIDFLAERYIPLPADVCA